MRVLLRHPRREIEVPGPRQVRDLLADLGFASEAHLVIADGTLVPADTVLGDDAVIEIRPVISGGT